MPPGITSGRRPRGSGSGSSDDAALRLRSTLPLHLIAALVLSVLIGLSLGLLGGGGSILAVPVLVYVARIDTHAAIGMSLAVVGSTALVGGLVHRHSGQVDLRAVGLFGGPGMLGAVLGARATHLFPSRVLMLAFAGLMLVVGGLMLRGRPRPAAEAGRHPLAVPAAGLGVGVLTGFLGVGGGFLIVPALVMLGGLPMHTAVGTSLLVIALSSAAGVAGHVGRDALPLGLSVAFTAAAVAGALVGARLALRLEPQRLRRAFAVFVVLVGLALLVRNALPA
jgi:uncharacterized membrane protein YfcA